MTELIQSLRERFFTDLRGHRNLQAILVGWELSLEGGYKVSSDFISVAVLRARKQREIFAAHAIAAVRKMPC
jgi:hypothetical protein